MIAIGDTVRMVRAYDGSPHKVGDTDIVTYSYLAASGNIMHRLANDYNGVPEEYLTIVRESEYPMKQAYGVGDCALLNSKNGTQAESCIIYNVQQVVGIGAYTGVIYTVRTFPENGPGEYITVPQSQFISADYSLF